MTLDKVFERPFIKMVANIRSANGARTHAMKRMTRKMGGCRPDSSIRQTDPTPPVIDTNREAIRGVSLCLVPISKAISSRRVGTAQTRDRR